MKMIRRRFTNELQIYFFALRNTPRVASVAQLCLLSTIKTLDVIRHYTAVGCDHKFLVIYHEIKRIILITIARGF